MTAFVTAHDAGGAEALSDYLSVNRIEFDCSLTGPAKTIFKRKFKALREAELTSNSNHSEVYAATSMVSMTERNALTLARNIGIRSYVVVDSSDNIIPRFSRNGTIILPDVFVSHSISILDRLREAFPNHDSFILDETYYIARVSRLPPSLYRDACLYVTDPLSSHALNYFGDENYYGFNEFEALEGFLKNIESINSLIKKVFIRVHPDEQADKYKSYCAVNPVCVKISNEPDLLVDLSGVNFVYGCNNTAMYIAHLAGRQVTSVLPRRIARFGIYGGIFRTYRF